MATRTTASMSSCLCYVLLVAGALLAVATADPAKIGVCHGRVGSNLPAPEAAAALLTQNGITKARLFLPDPAVLPAFAAAGIDLTVGVPNENLTYLSTSGPDGALQWLRSSGLAANPVAARLRYLVVGNEVLYNNQFYAPHLVPAMRNLHAALATLGLDRAVKVSSAHASSVLAASYPPSAGAFDVATLDVLRPMLRFLADTGAPFMLNAYPFISHLSGPANVPLDYALSSSSSGAAAAATVVRDGGLAYTGLFDATVDAVAAALEREGFGGVAVAVTETGWPTAGHPDATLQNAAVYNGGVAERAARGAGTPRQPGTPVEVFLFDLYDEDGKPGAEIERHFGIFKADGTKAYDISFT
ncbi:glucan endo-1,3-beta-glucosidase-like [Lolium rigidum]|uniref:glucan endo-1,3-beta-glucosidase-like n=1 Tax=Lolium rigidum TaxID=89674 RepID=UPI001F5C1C38|nr:glucan endo-1,3-beta-glucosidase-like [Lolium rigidum]